MDTQKNQKKGQERCLLLSSSYVVSQEGKRMHYSLTLNWKYNVLILRLFERRGSCCKPEHGL